MDDKARYKFLSEQMKLIASRGIRLMEEVATKIIKDNAK